MEAKRNIIIGCCGFAASFQRYINSFRVVEIQQTFYQPPAEKTVLKWRQKAPSNFEFTLKAWQIITHPASSPTYRKLKIGLKDIEKKEAGFFRATSIVKRAWDLTLKIARILKANKIVFQCPPGFEPTEENMQNMKKFFSSIDRKNITCIWEPRGNWKPEQILHLCNELNLIHCVDPFKSKTVTAGLRYFRLHGMGGYRYSYTSDDLKKLVEICNENQNNKTVQYYVLFNNSNMLPDALKFQKLIAGEC